MRHTPMRKAEKAMKTTVMEFRPCTCTTCTNKTICTLWRCRCGHFSRWRFDCIMCSCTIIWCWASNHNALLLTVWHGGGGAGVSLFPPLDATLLLGGCCCWFLLPDKHWTTQHYKMYNRSHSSFGIFRCTWKVQIRAKIVTSLVAIPADCCCRTWLVSNKRTPVRTLRLLAAVNSRLLPSETLPSRHVTERSMHCKMTYNDDLERCAKPLHT